MSIIHLSSYLCNDPIFPFFCDNFQITKIKICRNYVRYCVLIKPFKNAKMTSSKKKKYYSYSIFHKFCDTWTKNHIQKYIMANLLMVVLSVAGDCWEESVSRIFPLCVKHSMLLYHLSLVHALRGDAQNSLRSYNDFRS